MQNCHPVEVANFTFSESQRSIFLLQECAIYLLIMEIVPNFLVLIIIIFIYSRE